MSDSEHNDPAAASEEVAEAAGHGGVAIADETEVDSDAGSPVDAAPSSEAVDSAEDLREALKSAPGDWYVVHSYAGYENRVKQNLEQRSVSLNVEDRIFESAVPQEEVVQIKNGDRKTIRQNKLPGYVLVRMELDAESWGVVRNTPGVTGFVGNATNPPAVSDAEVRRLTEQLTEGVTKPTPKVEFEEGDQVRVTDGPFANFNGTVEEVKPEKQKVRVLVSIFGRSTPVELDFMQVEKVA